MRIRSAPTFLRGPGLGLAMRTRKRPTFLRVQVLGGVKGHHSQRVAWHGKCIFTDGLHPWFYRLQKNKPIASYNQYDNNNNNNNNKESFIATMFADDDQMHLLLLCIAL